MFKVVIGIFFKMVRKSLDILIIWRYFNAICDPFPKLDSIRDYIHGGPFSESHEIGTQSLSFLNFGVFF